MPISELMARLDRLRFEHEPEVGRSANWRPQSSEGREIFEQLTAQENRQALRDWYAQFEDTELNESARLLKESLEAATGEELL